MQSTLSSTNVERGAVDTGLDLTPDLVDRFVPVSDHGYPLDTRRISNGRDSKARGRRYEPDQCRQFGGVDSRAVSSVAPTPDRRGRAASRPVSSRRIAWTGCA
jgi:hypothetical protein